MPADDDLEDFTFGLDTGNLDDIELDPSDLAEFGLLGVTSDDALSKELGSSSDAKAVSPAHFGMIRAMKGDEADYNIDNVTLTAEDMNDPELLAELAKMGFKDDAVAKSTAMSKQTVAVASSESVDDGEMPLELKLECDDRGQMERYVAEEKARAVALKKTGDLDGARASLQAYKALQARLGEMSSVEPDEPGDDPVERVRAIKAEALQAKRAGDLERARELMGQVMAIEGSGAAAPRPPPVAQVKPVVTKAKLKEVVAALTEQFNQSVEAAKVYLKMGQTGEASLFLSRKKAIESDLMQVKNCNLGNKPLPPERMVTLQLPLDTENSDVGEDELKVHVSQINEKSKKIGIFSSSFDHYINVTLSETEKTSALFKPMQGSRLSETITFAGCVKRDVRAIKFFEYQKLRVDLVKKEPGLFKSKHVVLGSASVKLAPLLTQPSLVDEQIELLDEARRSIGLSITLTVKINRPLSNKVSSSKTVQWMVFDGEPFVTGKLFPDGRAASPSKVAPPAGSEPAETSDVDEIVSYAVIEHELEQLYKNPATSTDPVLTTKQLALEAKKDDFDLKFQTCQISFEDYLASLREAVGRSKARALEAKRAGNINAARHHMIHVQLIEKEIASAADMDQEEE